jgi:spore maturation protein CgeB
MPPREDAKLRADIPLTGLSIACFGSGLASSARPALAPAGVLRALAARGHVITLYEPDSAPRHHCAWARTVYYQPNLDSAFAAIDEARDADVIIKAGSREGLDDMLTIAVADLRDPSRLVAYWDLDAPATLARLLNWQMSALRQVLPAYDLVLAQDGGAYAVSSYMSLGAAACVPINSALDPELSHAAPPDPRFEADLLFVGDRSDRDAARIEKLFFSIAERVPDLKFVLGGRGWHDREMPANVRYVGHIFPKDLNSAYATARLVLCLDRVRMFEAGGAGGTVIADLTCDAERFLTPGREVLLVSNAGDIIEQLGSVPLAVARRIGEAGRQRLLHEHTYAHRARQVETIFLTAQPNVSPSFISAWQFASPPPEGRPQLQIPRWPSA